MAPSKKRNLRKKKKNHKFAVKVGVHEFSASSYYSYRFKPFQDERPKKKSEAGKNLEDIPADLVENILERLYSADRIRFGSTCKKNLSFVTSTKHGHPHRYEFRTIDRIPWLADFFCFGNFHSSFRLNFLLFEPLHLQGRPNYVTYHIHNPKGEDLGSGIHCQLKASRKGWFLCLWPKQEDEQQAGLTSFLLFSPFNKRVIKLPDSDHNLGKYNVDRKTCLATFSSDPTSPDCVYFFLSHDSISGKIRISTLRQRSRKWKTRVFNLASVSSVVHHEGCFYCVSTYGHLAAYDVLRQSLEVIIPSSPVPYWNFRILHVKYHILVCEGKLLLAYLEIPPHSGYDIEKLRCGLFELSSSTRTWVRRTSLGNHALFLGDHTSFAVPVSSSSWSSCDDNIADRMYFYPTILDQVRPIYYSFKDGRCHAPKEGGYWSSPTGLVGRRIWIEPPLYPSELA